MPAFTSKATRRGHIFRNYALLMVALATCGSVLGQSGPSLPASADALGAGKLTSIEFSATGRWYQFGQAPSPSLPWPQFDVTSYKATINYAIPAAHVQIVRKQSEDPGRQRPVPIEQKPDQYVNGSVAWNLAPPPGSAAGSATVPQPQPDAVEERIADIWATPQGFLKAALANQAVSRPVAGGQQVSFSIGNHKYTGLINSNNQVTSVTTWIDTPVLGDTPVEYTYSGYKYFNGVLFPEQILRKQGGYPVLQLQVAAVKADVNADIPVPAQVRDAHAPLVTVTSEELAPGVYYLRGGTHHSVAIEQRDYVVLVEAPLNEARSEALIAKIKDIIPNKPIRFVINTHQHFDHSGGLRTFADAGSIIVTQQQNAAYYSKIWAAPHSINPDHLALSRKQPKFKTFTDKLVLTDGARPIEIHRIVGSGHDDTFALIYLPKEKILIEADAYTPAVAGAPLPATPNPYSVNLYENVQRLKLDVQSIAALHGPAVATIDDLRAAINVSSTASK